MFLAAFSPQTQFLVKSNKFPSHKHSRRSQSDGNDGNENSALSVPNLNIVIFFRYIRSFPSFPEIATARERVSSIISASYRSFPRSTPKGGGVVGNEHPTTPPFAVVESVAMVWKKMPKNIIHTKTINNRQ